LLYKIIYEPKFKSKSFTKEAKLFIKKYAEEHNLISHEQQNLEPLIPIHQEKRLNIFDFGEENSAKQSNAMNPLTREFDDYKNLKITGIF